MELILPSKLKNEPFVEAVCEIYVNSPIGLHNILPGIFFSKYPNDISEITQQPLFFAPQIDSIQQSMAVNSVSIQLKWDSFRVVVGPGVISIFAAIPYVGWEEFSKAINKILKTVLETEQVTRIERYSIKYANILNSKDFPKGLDALNLKLNLGDFVLNNEQAQIRLEIQMESYLTIFTLSSVVNMQYPGGAILEGVLIDIDTINKNPISDIVNFKNELPNLLNDIHAKNKTFFFKTLKRETIQALGPSYDN